MHTLFVLFTLIALLVVETGRRVRRARTVYRYLPQNSPIYREGGLGSKQLLRSETLPGSILILLLLCEDDLFFEHRGFNFRELKNRLKAFRRGGPIAGGSSISQQVVKRLFLQRTPRWLRKILEIPFTLWLEVSFTKDEILSLYISNIFLGIQVMGLRDAALAYFGKEPQELSVQESLLLFISIASPIKSLREISVNSSITAVDFRRAFWKLKDLYRIQHVLAAHLPNPDRDLSYQDAKVFMRNFSQFDPNTACSDGVEEILFRRALVALADLLRISRNLPHRTPSQVRSCREILPREFREVLEAGILHTRTSTPRRSIMAAPNDWDRMLKIAAWHGMVLPLWESWSQRQRDLPDDVLALFQNEVQRRMIRLTQIQSLTEQLKHAVDQNGLGVLFIKGLALIQLSQVANTASDPGDIDLLVKAPEFAELHRILGQNGFAPLFTLTPAQRERILADGEGIAYTNSDGLHVDVHTLISSAIGEIVSLDRAIDQAVSLPSGMRTLAAEMYVPYLALHGLKHRWSRVSWVLAYACLVERSGIINWEAVFSYASEQNVVKPILLANFLAQELFEVDLGPAMQLRFSKQIVELAGQFIDRYFETPTQKVLNDYLRLKRAFDTRRQSSAYFWSRLFHPGSSDIANADGFLQKMFPLLQKGGRFLKLWKTA